MTLPHSVKLKSFRGSRRPLRICPHLCPLLILISPCGAPHCPGPTRPRSHPRAFVPAVPAIACLPHISSYITASFPSFQLWLQCHLLLEAFPDHRAQSHHPNLLLSALALRGGLLESGDLASFAHCCVLSVEYRPGTQ